VTEPNRRRQILIGGLQYRLLAIDLCHTLAVVLVFAIGLFGRLAYQLDRSDLSPLERDLAAREFLVLHERVWLPLLLAVGLLILHSIFVSHRIAGPLYQFRRLLRRLSEGDLTVRARLRRKDYLCEEADLFNEVLDSLEAGVLHTREQVLEVCASVAELKDLTRPGSAERFDVALAMLEERTSRLRDMLEPFHTLAEAALAADVAAQPASGEPTVMAGL
jgi:methyl-accepting chemotaxis protein